MVFYYFTKWDEVMPTFNNMTYTTTHLFFNHVITRFQVPQQLVLDHDLFFENEVFRELCSLLGFTHNFTSPYYTQSNGQVDIFNKVIKTMLQWKINKQKPTRTT
jgi:hypothetical protein